MPRNLKITLAILSIGVLIGLVSLRSLHRRIQGLQENPTSEEQVRRELLATTSSAPTDARIQARIFWAAGPDRIGPVQVAVALSPEPVKRAKQVLNELITHAPTADQRTLPADAVVLGFYILPDGTAIADFSEALASEMPSGILSEQMAVDSIRGTLESNVPGLSRLKILIHGQEVETLAGHVDLTGFFDLNPPNAEVPSTPAGSTAGSSVKRQ